MRLDRALNVGMTAAVLMPARPSHADFDFKRIAHIWHSRAARDTSKHFVRKYDSSCPLTHGARVQQPHAVSPHACCASADKV